jgi:N-acyl-L-homoserine lactone synthetase
MNDADELTGLSPPAIWDRFAAHFLCLNPEVQFGLAQDEAELETVFRLRYATVVEKGWRTPGDLPNGLERDAYDARALQVVGRNTEGQIVATVRLVLPQAGQRLPIEAAFDLTIEPHSQVVDVGRAIVTPACTDSQRHLAFLGLLCQSWFEIRARGLHEMCGAATKSMLRLYRLMDIHWAVLGDARTYWNEVRLPCKLDLDKTVDAYLQRHRDMLSLPS